MAELIPLQYRLKHAQRRYLAIWSIAVIGAMAVAAGGLGVSYVWYSQRTSDLAQLKQEYNKKKAIIAEAHEMQAKKKQLADRQAKISELTNDNRLLMLLNSVSAKFSDSDCVEYLAIDAHPDAKPTDIEALNRYNVRITGVSKSYETYSQLTSRLGSIENPPLTFVAGESNGKKDKILDSKAWRFVIRCEKGNGG